MPDKRLLTDPITNSLPSRRSVWVRSINGGSPTDPSGDMGRIEKETFANSTATRFTYGVMIPGQGIEGPFHIRYHWYQDGGTTGDVDVNVWLLTVGDDDTMNITATKSALNDTATAAGAYHISPWSSAITVTGTYVDEDLYFVGMERLGSDGDDTFTGTMVPIAMELSYITTNELGWSPL